VFGFIKKKAQTMAIRSMFDSALSHATRLNTSLQRQIAGKIKTAAEDFLSESDPLVAEQKLLGFLHQATFRRQMLVKAGAATSQSDPDWLEAALCESLGQAGASGDRETFEYVIGRLIAWFKLLDQV